MVRRYAEVADAGSIFMDHFTDRDKLRLLYTLAVNAHPILLQVRGDSPPQPWGGGSGWAPRGPAPGLALFPFTVSLGATPPGDEPRSDAYKGQNRGSTLDVYQ